MHFLAFEGDFIETYEGLIFDVKGILHPQDRKIAYLRYIPARLFNLNYQTAQSNEKKRIIREIEEKFRTSVADIRFGREVYVKLYDIPSRFQILSHFEPEYIFHSKLYDFPLQSVPNQEIKTIHAPEVFLKKTLKSTTDTSLRNLVDFIHKGGNIPLTNIGLSGSAMVGLEKGASDYDLILYGKEESRRVHTFLNNTFAHSKKLRVGSSTIHPYSHHLWKKHYNTRAEGFDIKFKDFKAIERKKIHQFLVDGKEVFIRFLEIHRSSAILPQFESSSFKNLGRVSLTGIILEDSKSIFTPGRYTLKISGINSENKQIKEKTIELFTLRGRFLEQARNGDTVSVKGKLELVSDIKMQNSYQRIVIGTDPDDFMVPI